MFVLDCSVTLAWCLPDENDTYTDQVLDLLIEQQAIVPALWHLEVMNVLLIAERKKRLTAEHTRRILETLRPLNISTYRQQPHIETVELMQFAQQHQLTSYDAAYLHLAHRENLPLATLDKQMRSAAQQLNLYLEL